MSDISAEELARVNSFPKLVALLRDKLEWPIDEDYEFEDVIFEYDPHELGLKEEETAKVREIHQLRPLVTNQPWGVFFISFEEKQLSVTVLRRILRALVLKQRGAAVDRQAWDKSDLIFAANFGRSGERELAFVHFSDGAETGDLPVMKVLGWNAKDTKLHNNYAAEMLTSRLAWPADQSDNEAWRNQWSSAFEIGYRQVIRTSRELALHLAGLATQIRARANELLDAEAEDGPMRTMLEAFRKNLIHDLDEDGFADMFAQTICYGMLAAAISRESGALVADNMADMVPRTNPFLKELFANFLKLGGRDKRSNLDFDELGVREVVDMLQSADMPAVLRDFGDRNPKEDPVIHFYELFLKEYDPAKRMQRGVFYTPRPVVNFIVRGVDEILRTEFDLPLGLADTTTWGELAERNDKITIPDHIDPDQPFVQILDPATGTGTFLVEVIDLIHKRMVGHWQDEGKSKDEIAEAWNEYVPADLLPRLTAFELMMAPYAIAHMKVGLKLTETGYKFSSDERARILLTNALEEKQNIEESFGFVSEALAHEAMVANAAKGQSFAVVIGNPPYSNFGRANDNDWVKGLTADFYGNMTGESKVNLYDDYIKFIRLSLHFVERNEIGVIGMITNRSYLDGSTQREMRRYLLEASHKVVIADLYRGIYDPFARQDENVFQITTGVSIGIFALSSRTKKEVFFKRCLSDLSSKFDALATSSIAAFGFQTLEPEGPEYLLIESGESSPEYDSAPKVPGLFVESTTGVQTNRDALTLDEDPATLLERISEFSSSTEAARRICNELGVAETSFWSPTRASQVLRNRGVSDERAIPYDYRPFEKLYIYYDDAVVHCPRELIRTDVAFKDNLSLLVSRGMDDPAKGIAFVSGSAPDKRILKSARGEAKVFPLKLERNLLQAGESAGSNIVSSQFRNYGANEIFAYAYAILNSPKYRERYDAKLRLDYPRIPIPKDRATFAALVPLGRRLVALHLLKPEEESTLKNPDIRFAGTGEARAEKGYPKYKNGKVEINANRWFEDVPKETWEFHVGGYQVCDKWLRDRAGKGGQNPRPGRVLTEEDVLHYRRVVTALTETRKIMAEIDEAIEKHGGWPGAFSIGSDPKQGA